MSEADKQNQMVMVRAVETTLPKLQVGGLAVVQPGLPQISLQAMAGSIFVCASRSGGAGLDTLASVLAHMALCGGLKVAIFEIADLPGPAVKSFKNTPVSTMISPAFDAEKNIIDLINFLEKNNDRFIILNISKFILTDYLNDVQNIIADCISYTQYNFLYIEASGEKSGFFESIYAQAGGLGNFINCRRQPLTGGRDLSSGQVNDTMLVIPDLPDAWIAAFRGGLDFLTAWPSIGVPAQALARRRLQKFYNDLAVKIS